MSDFLEGPMMGRKGSEAEKIRISIWMGVWMSMWMGIRKGKCMS